METKKSTIKDLIPDDKNFNTGSEYGGHLIEKSFKKFGAGRSILLDKNNKIIAGNKSTEHYAAGGGDSVIVVESDGKSLIAVKRMDIDLDTPQGREMALADNAAAKANIIFDAELVEAELGVAICQEWGVELKNAEVKEDDFDVPVGGSETDIVEGDIFDIGQHRLLCGSSTQTDTWKRLMGDELADLVITDPPYNVAYTGGTKEKLTILNDSMSDGNFYQFLYDFYTALGSYTKTGGAWYVWHADSEGANFRQAMKDAGIMVKQCLIWVKNSMVMGRQDYQWKHEPSLYGWKEGAAHYFTNERTHTTVIEDKIDIKKLTKEQMKNMLIEIMSDKNKTTIINCDKPYRNAEHPTMKPILLLAPLIKNSSKENELVADGFLGSGSTMVASHQLKRKCYGMELDPKYCQVIIERMIKLNPSIKITKNGKEWNTTKIS